MFVGQGECFFEAVGSDDAEHGAEDFFGVDAHVSGDVVEEAGADEEAFGEGFTVEFCVGGAVLTAVDDEVCACFYAFTDELVHAVECGLAHQGAVGGVGVEGVADLEARDALFELGAEVVGGFLADGDGDGDGHAAFAGGAVGGTDEGVGNEVEVGVGEDQHVVLSAAEALSALAGGCAAFVNVLRDGGGADEANGLDGGGVEDGVDCFLIAVDDVEDTLGAASFDEQFGEAQRDGGVALGGLEDEGVAGCQCGAGLPQRDHCREVMPETTPRGWRME